MSMNAFTGIYIGRLLNWNAYTITKRVVLSVRLLVVLKETVGQPLNKEIVDAFVAKIVVYDRERVEIKWKFRDEFRELEKGEICSK